jgi:hypothetical protein
LLLDAQNRDSPTIPGRTAAIFLLSAAGILLQVSLTRILSLVAWHHFAYLIISLALLGIGAAGTYLTFALRTQTRASISPWIARFSFFFAVSVLVCLLLVVHIRFDPIKIYLSAQFSELWGLVLIEIAVAIPFFFAGTAVGAILSTSGSDIGGVYFADLAGAAGGGLLSLLLVETLGAQSSIFMAAALAAGAACVLTWRAGIGVPRRYALTVALGSAGSWIRFPFGSRPPRWPRATSTRSRRRAGTRSRVSTFSRSVTASMASRGATEPRRSATPMVSDP